MQGNCFYEDFKMVRFHQIPVFEVGVGCQDQADKMTLVAVKPVKSGFTLHSIESTNINIFPRFFLQRFLWYVWSVRKLFWDISEIWKGAKNCEKYICFFQFIEYCRKVGSLSIPQNPQLLIFFAESFCNVFSDTSGVWESYFETSPKFRKVQTIVKSIYDFFTLLYIAEK